MSIKAKRVYIISTVLLIFAIFSTHIFAVDQTPGDYYVHTYTEDGHTVTEGDRTLDMRSRDIVGSFTEYVGVDSDRSDYGPWNYGTDIFLVFSQYINPKYVHGSSVLGATLVRGDLKPGGQPAYASTNKSPSNNHAYWKVEK